MRLEINALLGLLANPATRYLVTGRPTLVTGFRQAIAGTGTHAPARPATTQMAYHAVRDITCVIFCTNPNNWKLLGYPRPMEL